MMPDDNDDRPVIYRAEGAVARITLNRPAQLNAINGTAHQLILAGLELAAADDTVRSVVISGNGKAFSAGGDIKAVAAGEDVGDPKDLGLAIWNLPKPVIAAVHGYCLGQAFEIAAVCDFTIAAESARFGEVEINHGWGPPLLVTPYVTGIKAAKEILMLGEIMDAHAALRLGLVNWVVPDADLDEAVRAVTDRFGLLEPAAVRSNKRLVNSTHELAGFLTALDQRTQPTS